MIPEHDHDSSSPRDDPFGTILAPIPETDRGFTLGDGLFETILAKRGLPVLFDEHMDRMALGAEALGLPTPNRTLARELVDAGLDGALGRTAVRLTYSAGSGGRGLDRPTTLATRLIVGVNPTEQPSQAATLAMASVRRNPTSPASRHKTLSYLDSVVARREAREVGADEALMLDTHGRVASAAAANVFWVAAGRLETPSLDCGVLPGIMRAHVIAAARRLGVAVEEVEMGPERLGSARGLFLTNSLIGVRPVNRLDGVAIAPDPLVERLAAAVADVT